MSERPPTFGGRRGFGSSLTAGTKLTIVAIICVLIGIEIGFILSQGGGDLGDLLIRWFLYPKVEPVVAISLLCLAIILLPFEYQAIVYLSDLFNRKVSKSMKTLLLGILLLLCIAVPPTGEEIMALWVPIFLLFVLGRLPVILLILTIVALILIPVLGVKVEPAFFYLPVIILIAFTEYPHQISLKRFLFPRRGAL